MKGCSVGKTTRGSYSAEQDGDKDTMAKVASVYSSSGLLEVQSIPITTQWIPSQQT